MLHSALGRDLLLAPPGRCSNYLDLGLASGLRLFAACIACPASFPSSFGNGSPFLSTERPPLALGPRGSSSSGHGLGPAAQNITSTQRQRVIKEWAPDPVEQSEPVGLHPELLLEPPGEKCSLFPVELAKGPDASRLATRGGTCLRAEPKAALTDAESRTWPHPT